MTHSEWTGAIFLILGALVTLAEIHTLTIYLLAVALGLFASGAAALAGASFTMNLAVLAVVTLLGLPAAHWWRGKLRNRAAEDLMNDDVGQTVVVAESGAGGIRVTYRGTTWNARLQASEATACKVGENYVVVRREGNLLVIAPQGK
ncbi:MAG TPA: NfeD family protein [Castellaniella sp.]|uniref:NfeD family protein n=1 Tax=Castellaniella sp. TaxID=1955812 RepID=UPI002EEA966E